MSDEKLEIQDRVLLKLAIYEGDLYAQKYLYIKYKPAVCQFIRNTGNLDWYVNDLVHEVFVNIYEGKCKYSGNTDVQGYLYGIAKNVVKYHIRREKRQVLANLIYHNNVSIIPNTPTKIKCESENYRFNNFQETLIQAISKLPKKSSEAVKLVLIHKKTPRQAATKLGCSSAVFRNRLHYGLKRLRMECFNFSDFFRP